MVIIPDRVGFTIIPIFRSKVNKITDVTYDTLFCYIENNYILYVRI